MTPPAPRRVARGDFLLGLLVPVAVIVASYGLTVFANAAIRVGPFDRAMFGWLVPMPMWSVSPVVAAVLWRRFRDRSAVAIAGVMGFGLAGAATLLIYSSWAATVCDFGLNRSKPELLAEALPVGVVIGGGWAASALISRSLLVGGRRWTALFIGAGCGFGLIFAAITAGVLTNLFLPVCNRPP